MFGAFSPASALDQGQRLETAVFNALRRRTPAVRTGSVCRLLIKEKSKSHEVDFVAGDALLMRAYSLIQVSADMASEKRASAKLPRLMPRWPSSILASRQSLPWMNRPIFHASTVWYTLCPHGSGSLPNHLWACGVRTSWLLHHGWGAPCCARLVLGFDARQENLGEVVGLEFGGGVCVAVFANQVVLDLAIGVAVAGRKLDKLNGRVRWGRLTRGSACAR